MASFLQRDTRRYAKRQLTWFRADPEMVWIDRQERGLLDEMILKFINKT
jgi:tRNA dimethylallyltransferase